MKEDVSIFKTKLLFLLAMLAVLIVGYGTSFSFPEYYTNEFKGALTIFTALVGARHMSVLGRPWGWGLFAVTGLGALIILFVPPKRVGSVRSFSNNSSAPLALNRLISKTNNIQSRESFKEISSANRFAQAVEWYRKAAEQGHANAQNNLGAMYEYATGVPQDDAQAVEWYRKAAEQGDAFAQNNLGWMYLDGNGVIQDNVYAHMWINIAASRGYEDGKKARDTVAKKMTAADISKGQELARACVKKNYKGC